MRRFVSLAVALVGLTFALNAQAALRFVRYDQDLQLRDRVIAARIVHADLGGFVLVRADRAQLAALGVSGVEVPGLRAGERLAAQFDRGVRVPLTGVRLLIDAGRFRLIAGSEAALAALRRPGVYSGGLQFLDVASCYEPVAQTAGQVAVPLAADPRISAMVAKVSKQNLTQHITALSALYTRNARSSYNAQAVQYLETELAKIPGLTVTKQSWSTSYGPNVIGEIQGYELPNEIVMTGAHFDSIAGWSTSNRAPGADDNASGTATVLELARICAETPLRRTVRFGFWNAEEYGLYGSGAYASAAKQRGDKIIAYLNNDMNAYRASGDTVDVDFIINDSTTSLIAQLTQISQLYVPTLGVKQGYLSAGTSDHRSFFRNGFPAVFYFEDLDKYSPYIHSANDTIPLSANDMDLATLISQSVGAGVWTIAEPLDAPSFTLSATSGPSVGGTRVNVSGSALVQVQGVKVGGRSVPFDTSNGLSFETPVSSVLGAVSVEIENPAGVGKASFSYTLTSPSALRLESPALVGGTSDFAIGGPAGGAAVSFISGLQGTTSLGLVQLDIGAGQLGALVLFDVGGLARDAGTLERTLQIPQVPALAGAQFYMQVITLDAQLSKLQATNAAPLRIQ